MKNKIKTNSSWIKLGLISTLISMSTLSYAGSQQDAAFLLYKQAVIAAKQSGQAEQARVNAANEQAARSASNVNCNEMNRYASAAAAARKSIYAPPDPTKIIANTTCFIDVAAIQIPIPTTGFGLLDSLIQGALGKFLKNQCAKGTAFLNDLKSTATSAISGNAASAFGYITTNLPTTAEMNALYSGVTNAATAATGAVTGNLATTGAHASGPTACPLNAMNLVDCSLLPAGTPATTTAGPPSVGPSVGPAVGPVSSSDSSLATMLLNAFNTQSSNLANVGSTATSVLNTQTQNMCGLASTYYDATYCPSCMSNPTHASCKGQKPECVVGSTTPGYVIDSAYCVNPNNGNNR